MAHTTTSILEGHTHTLKDKRACDEPRMISMAPSAFAEERRIDWDSRHRLYQCV